MRVTIVLLLALAALGFGAAVKVSRKDDSVLGDSEPWPVVKEDGSESEPHNELLGCEVEGLPDSSCLEGLTWQDDSECEEMEWNEVLDLLAKLGGTKRVPTRGELEGSVLRGVHGFMEGQPYWIAHSHKEKGGDLVSFRRNPLGQIPEFFEVDACADSCMGYLRLVS